MEDVVKAILETDLENEERVDEVLKSANVSDKATAAVKGALRLLNAYKSEVPSDLIAKIIKADAAEEEEEEEEAPAEGGAPEKGKVPPQFLKAKKAKKSEDAAKAEGGKEEDMKETCKSSDECPLVKKSADGKIDLENVPVAIRPQLQLVFKQNEEIIAKAAQLEAKATELENQLKAEKDRRKLDEFVTKAKSEYSHLPGKAEELGAVLKSASETMTTAQFSQFETVLKSAEEVAKTGMKPLGSDLPREGSGNSAWDEIVGKAKSLVQKSDNLTEPQAISLVLRNEPELYKRYLAEGKH